MLPCRAIPEINAALAAFVSDPNPYILPGDGLDLRALASELEFLPVILDMGGCLGLRPNGDAASFLWNEPRKLRSERDERIRNIAYYRGCLKHRELIALMPARPSSGVDCPHCRGTGYPLGIDDSLRKAVMCYCGGLGWLPSE